MKDKLKKVFAALGFTKKAAELTSEEQLKVSEKYKEMFQSDMLEDYNLEKENAEKAKQLTAVMEVLGEGDDEGEGEDNEKAATAPEAVAKLKKENESLKKENNEKEAKIAKLGKVVEKDEPKVIELSAEVFGRPHSQTHLFGLESDFFSLNKRWNKLMVNPGLKPLDVMEDKKVFAQFQNETMEFGAAVAKRYQFLQSIGKLPKKGAAFTQTITSLADADLGSQFVVMRQDALIARIMELPNVYDIFPRRFNVQDNELMTNAFFGEFSQAWQTGTVWKGSMELKPEVGYVDDAMFKTLFESMKWLERQYVGYLNQEGSDPMKWSLIEWTLLQIATKLTMEQYERRILGVYVKPVATEAGNYMHASTGYIYTLLRYVHENKLQAFTEVGLSTYDNTATSFVDAVTAMYEKFKTVAPNLPEAQFEMLLNANHRFWYKSQIRAKYGLQSDFDGPIDTKVPDTEMPIKWVPNMKQLTFMVITRPNNFQALENLPGEMLAMQFQADMESYKAWSVWKEGFSASFVGKAFATPAALLANNFANQEVFMNKPVTVLDADATTADATENFWFKTQANSQATALTDFAGAVAGVAYILENGDTANDTTIAKAGKFSEITDAYTPTHVGDYWMGVYDTTASKFFELERCVGGTRTVNALKQPYIPGAR